MLHEVFICWSHFSVEQETTVTLWQRETIYSYQQVAANSVSFLQGVCLVILPMHLLTCDTRETVCSKLQSSMQQPEDNLHIFLN